MPNILESLAKKFMGKGIDKRFPFLVGLYKKTYTLFSSDGDVEVKIPLSSKLFVSKKDSGLGLMLRTKGKFEPEQTKKFIKSIKKGDVVIDVGANVGYYSVLASKLVGKTGKAYAFEPDPRNLRLLYKNLKANGCDNVEVVESALGNKKGKLLLTQDLSNPGENSLATDKRGRKISVDAIRLDDFVKKTAGRVNLIKIDVEGAELDVLRGGLETIGKSGDLKMFIESNPAALKRFGESELFLMSFLKGSDFQIVGQLDGFTNLFAVKKGKTVKNPPVSVLMSVYNAEEFISESVKSILDQTYRNFELVIVDDGSTDKTLGLLKDLSATDKRVRVIKLRKNLGPSLAGNIGLKSVRGEYLFRMDADDIAEADRLEKQVEFLQFRPEVAMLGGQCRLIDIRGKVVGKKTFPIDNKSIVKDLFVRNPIQHPTSVINLKNLTIQAMLNDGKSTLAHDLELVFLASKHGKLMNLKDVVLRYRQYSGSYSLRSPKQTFWDTLLVRFQSVMKYCYKPTLKGVLVTLVQFVLVSVLPKNWIYPVYSYLRGMKKFNVKGVKILGDAKFNFKKNYQLAQE